ncbi:MAG: glycosyltransferase [Flavobacteriales bacterium]|nr:glycosyltransferase [Flavobacteriales bacterium]
MKKISFVIPVFRNQGSIKITYDKIIKLVQSLNLNYEFVFVNDGSDDNSYVELIKLREEDNLVKVLSFSRNFGQVPALIAGYKKATGDCVISMAADLQEPVSLIEKMIDNWIGGKEIVICNRVEREDSFVSRVSSSIFYNLIKFANPKMPKGGFDFMLMDRKVINQLNLIDERNRFIQGDILWLGFETVFIPYSRQKRTIGKSQWTISKKLKYFIDGILNTSYIPIRFISLLGFINSLLGFVYAFIIIYNKLINNIPFKGWAPIMIIILITTGMIMIMLGIIGEYLWRTYDETRKRPLYIIKEDLS